LKKAILAFFNLAKRGAKLHTARKITTYVAILSSPPCDVSASRLPSSQVPLPTARQWPFLLKSAGNGRVLRLLPCGDRSDYNREVGLRGPSGQAAVIASIFRFALDEGTS
jgi:hypothetical protein